MTFFMKERPVPDEKYPRIGAESIKTCRLLLRRLNISDADDLVSLLNHKEITEATYYIPYPYTKQFALKWLDTQSAQFENGEQLTFGITLIDNSKLIGAISLTIGEQHLNGELGYWIGIPYWNKGYATEAAKAMVRYGFEVLKLQDISADYFASNQASAKIIRNLGMLQTCVKEEFIPARGKQITFYCNNISKEQFMEKLAAEFASKQLAALPSPK